MRFVPDHVECQASTRQRSQSVSHRCSFDAEERRDRVRDVWMPIRKLCPVANTIKLLLVHKYGEACSHVDGTVEHFGDWEA